MTRLAVGVASLLLALGLATSASAKIYKWTDEEGNVHYGDEPPQGAEAVDLPPPSTYEAPKRSRPAGSRDSRDEDAQQAGYSALAIASPEEESTILGPEQTITVRVTITPALRAGHTVGIFMDGEQVASGRGTQFSVSPVYRGAHTLEAVVRDGNGEEVSRSSPITFYKRQPSVINPQ
jgi:hypothetical protein